MSRSSHPVAALACLVGTLGVVALATRAERRERIAPPSIEVASARRRAVPAGPVNLATASAEEIEALPGVGPALAQRIVAHRAAHGPFRSFEELDAVKGIGPALLEKLRPRVSFQYRSTTNTQRNASDAATRGMPDG